MWLHARYLTFALAPALAVMFFSRAHVGEYLHLVWVGATGVTTFLVYAYDKAAARAGNRGRVPELTLHLLALLGGFAGGWLGRQLLRHKTQKPVFAVILLLATATHVTKLLGVWELPPIAFDSVF